MGNNLYGNGNGCYSHGNQFPSADTVLSLCNSTVYYCTITVRTVPAYHGYNLLCYTIVTEIIICFLYYKNAHMILLASVAYLGLSLP